MYLQKLEINGFKSFARKTSLEFNQGVTAVVGPNGSGKSNVAESIRWVMGEQSIKSLRGKQSTDVIFSGSDKSARLGMAQVTLVFNNEDQQAPIDYSEISISRRIHRDGHSDYFLNSQPTRLQDILLLLAQINLSSKTYSVIGQGMVDEILSVSPAQRREFFEEAAGVKPLQIKKQEATRKLDATQENLQTVTIQLNEIMPRLRSLTRQVKRLERRVEIENNLRDLQYHYYGETLFNLKNQHQESAKQESILTSQITQQEKEVNDLQSTMFSLTKESSHSDKFSEAQQKYEHLMSEKSNLKDQELQIRSELLQAARANQKTHVPISVVREVETKHETLHKRFNEKTEAARKHTTIAEWQLWHEELDKLFEEHDALLLPLLPFLQEQDVSDKEQELKKIQQRIATFDQDLENVQKQIRDLANLEKEEKSQIWQTQNKLQELQQKLNGLVNQRNEIRVTLARVETHMSDLEREVSNDIGVEFLDRLHNWNAGNSNQAETSKIREQMHKLKHELELIGGIDPEVQKEHNEIKERYDFLATQTSDLESGIAQLQKVIEELDQTIKRQFHQAFKHINQEFQKYFKMLFRGGKAELRLLRTAVDETQETDDESGEAKIAPGNDNDIAGVDITATPPGKKIKGITMLSGGERALTSIALISAIISNNPAPFVVLDEVDAALDEENSMRFAEIVDELSHKTQFVIITHNRATMERSDLLYGVTMGDDGISKLLSLKFEDATAYTNR